ncbi:unnamed protein product [Didymodactylos carnosus]|nr:unnamed protein product [Didymodactylos carnosus]CAF4462369.1 unnamed protein product [Didymodactylos carnosus]
MVVCTDNNDVWQRRSDIRLQHVVTKKYLHLTGDTYGRPISGQKEICAYQNMNSQNIWRTEEGVFIRPSSTDFSSGDNQSYRTKEEHSNDEL